MRECINRCLHCLNGKCDGKEKKRAAVCNCCNVCIEYIFASLTLSAFFYYFNCFCTPNTSFAEPIIYSRYFVELQNSTYL